ncbi:MAG: hypothetical protein H6922_05840 [Pseudomonadaceae bacterium]|nr:hypothetical protein [Pseudomonadaceae bacterium]
MRLARADAIAATVVLAAWVYVWTHPLWGWEVIPYLTLAKTALGHSWAEAHGWVYDWVRHLPDFWREDLLQRHFHRAAVAKDPESLRQLAVFYHANVGFYGLLAGLLAAGLSAGVAVMFTNLLGMGLLAGASWLWLRPAVVASHGWRRWFWWLVWLAIVLNPLTLLVMRASGPDGLAVGLLVAGMYGLTHGRWPWTAAAWIAMSLVQPITALLVVALLPWACVRAKPLVALLLGIAVLAGGLSVLFPGYGLPVLWQHTFGFPYTYPAGVTLVWEWPMYQATLLARLGDIGMVELAAWLLTLALAARMVYLRTPWWGVAVALLAGAIVREGMFPTLWAGDVVGVAVLVVLLALRPCLRAGKGLSFDA